MLCRRHSREGFTSAGRPCPQCRNDANSLFLLCSRCSECFDECEVCRVPLKSGRDPALIAAFKSAEAVAARQTMVDAGNVFDQEMQAALDAYTKRRQPFCDQLQVQSAPLYQQMESDNQPHRDEYSAVHEEVSEVVLDQHASDEQKQAARLRLAEADKKFRAACAQNRDRLQMALEPISKQFRQDTEKFDVELVAARTNAQTKFDAVKASSEDVLAAILASVVKTK